MSRKLPQPGSPGEGLLALLMKHYRIPPWQREYRFDGRRKWRFDFAWPERKLAVEIEGGVKFMGRHQRPQGFQKDCEKYNAAAEQGWLVLRFTTQQVQSCQAIDKLRKMF